MAFPISAIPAALSAVTALLRLRGRIDSIVSVKAAGDPLPFALPPLPDAFQYSDVDDMISFFAREGTPLLLAAGKMDDFIAFQALAQSQRTPARTDPLLEIYYRAKKQPGSHQSGDPSKALVEYYLVESCRLSNNPPYLRIILAVADILMEFAGDNASLFISNPKTANIVGSLLREFAGREDFDDDTLERIFKKLLGAAVVAALQSKDDLPDHPALLVLYAALAEVRSEKGDDFAAQIISAEGFTSVASAYLTIAAKDPGLSAILKSAAGVEGVNDPQWPLLRAAFAATLTTLGENLESVFRDPATAKNVLEAAIIAASANAGPLIRTLDDERPMLAAVLQEVASTVARQADLFDSLASGELIGEIYKVALTSVARNPDIDSGGVQRLVERIVGSLADELSRSSLRDTIEQMTRTNGRVFVRNLLARSLGVLSEAPELMEGDAAYVRAALGALLDVAGPLTKDGLFADDFIAILQETIARGLGIPNRDDIPPVLRALLAAVGRALNDADLRPRLSTPDSRKEAVLIFIRSAADGSLLWKALHDAGLLPTIVDAIVAGLKSEGAQILTEHRLTDAVSAILRVLHARGMNLIPPGPVDDAGKDLVKNLVGDVLTRAFAALRDDVGRRCSLDDVPANLFRVLNSAFARGMNASAVLHSAIDAVRTDLGQAA